MTKESKKPEIKDEPGAEERFKRGIDRALKTPPKQHADIKKKKDLPSSDGKSK